MSQTPPPIASLAGIGVPRRSGKASSLPPEKSGDITDNLANVAPPAPKSEPPAAPRSPTLPARADEIVVYWERLRRGRPFPSLAELDRGLVGNSWPGSLIVVFEGGTMSMPRVSRLGANDAIEYAPMVTEWILSRARQAVRRAMMVDEVQSFPMEGDTPLYRMLLLPFGSGGGNSDCVLCHLSHVS